MAAHQTFSQLLREGDRFTDRDFMRVLSIGHPSLKRKESDPSQFTIGEVVLLAALVEKPVSQLLEAAVRQASQDQESAQQREAAVSQAEGRKYQRRRIKPEE